MRGIIFALIKQIMRSVHLLIKGKVQGVFFRATAKDVAEELGMRGWVKNTSEGNVEIAASGEDEQVERFIEWCKAGPSMAKVSEVVVEETATIHFQSFSILR
jgi:acylphosphatase